MTILYGTRLYHNGVQGCGRFGWPHLGIQQAGAHTTLLPNTIGYPACTSTTAEWSTTKSEMLVF